MTFAKKVSLIERVSKSKLGLEGLQKVVYADRARMEDVNIENEKYNFEKIGLKMLKAVDGKYIQKKYNIEPSKEFGQRLHQERIKWLKNMEVLNNE